jgi:hypothetical protein
VPSGDNDQRSQPHARARTAADGRTGQAVPYRQDPRTKRQARPCPTPSGSIRPPGLSRANRSVQYVQIQRCTTALLLAAPASDLVRSPPRAGSRASSQAAMPAVLSGSGRDNPRRPPHRARSGHDLLIRSHPCGHPDPFRSVRDLGRAAARCSRESGELEGFAPVAPSVAPGRTPHRVP